MELKSLQFLKRFNKSFLILCLVAMSALAYAQSTTISGQIKDEANEGLPGVAVLIKGTSTGTVTDIDGNYTINVPNGEAILIFSYIGYLAQEVVVGTKSAINIEMAPDVTSLDEIVVIGYGEQKKSLTTGAISSVKAAELQTVSNGRIDQALQGRTAGVSIRPTSGSPGSGTKIRIRGTSSNGGSDPLFIIDGVRTGAAGMDYLSPNDVESIEILKDAASAAIYGAEGANGVIIVTTKSGKSNTGTITYNGQYGVQSSRPDLMPLMNAQQYQQYMTDANVAGAPTTADLNGVVGKGTNWLNEISENAPLQNHTISFNGGSDKSTFYVSGTMYKQQGVIGGDKSHFDRYTARFNSKHKVKDWLSVGENFSYSRIERKGISENTEYGSIVSSAIALDPLTPVTYTGTLPTHAQNAINVGEPLLYEVVDNQRIYYGVSNFVRGEYGNPIARLTQVKGKTVQNKILGNAYMELTPIKGLKLTSRIGIDAAFQRSHNWSPTNWYSSESQNTVANGSDEWNEWYTWQWENFASYDKTIGDHNITLLGGASLQKYTYNKVNGSYSGLFREEEKWSYGSNVPDNVDRISSENEIRTLRSYFGRISYDFMGKYLFNATLRGDGSSMLADGYQWGIFPSVSAGWVFSNESFYPQAISGVLNYAKLRASWGQNGSLSSLSPGKWQASISTDVDGVIRYPLPDGTYIVGAGPTALENPELKWETSEQLDLGLDLRFFDSKLNFSVDYYEKKTKDLITGGFAPLITGTRIEFVNAGDVLNKGFEFELGFSNASTSDLKYSINLNFSTLKNEVTYLNENNPKIGGVGVGGWGGATQFEEGRPIWYFNGYKTDGIFQTQSQVDQYLETVTGGYNPKPGDVVIVDTNGDNQISPEDQTYIGDAIPDYIFGSRFTVGYKGFDVLVFVQGQIGNEILMGFNRTDRATANKPAFFYEDRWTGNGSTNTWFAPNTSGTLVYSSDKMIFDGSFAKIRQMQLGYTLPSIVANSLKISNVRFYVSFDNFFTFTKYPGMDPEASTNDDRGQGIDRGYYPVPRTVLGGLTLSF